MNDMTPSSGVGFRSVLRVRMLHSQVRLRLLCSPRYDAKEYGVPINQEDLLATLGAFSVACIWSMERMNFTVSQEDREAYIAAWRYIGYFMGIQHVYLERFYRNYRSAEKHLCSSIAHLLEPELGKPSGMLPLQLLNAIKNRSFYGRSLEYHAELSRLLIGDELADIFQLPRGNLPTRLMLWRNITLMRLELWIGKWYRPGWEKERVRLMKEFVSWIVMWQVGKRQAFERTDFRYKMMVKDDESIQYAKATEGVKVNETSGTDGTDEKFDDNDGNLRIQVDRNYIKVLKRRYYLIILVEPALLVGGFLCAAVALFRWHITR